MYFFYSKTGLSRPIPPHLVNDFESIKWNEGERITIDSPEHLQTEMWTEAGRNQGQRNWKYRIYNIRHIIIDEGMILEH